MRKLCVLLPVVMLVVAACGSVSSSTVSGSTSSATRTTTTGCLTVTSGTIKQVSAGSLLLTDLQGKSVQVTLKGATTYIRQSTITPSGIKTGATVSVVVVLNADNTYSAVTVSLRGSLSRQGGFTGGAKLCSGERSVPSQVWDAGRIRDAESRRRHTGRIWRRTSPPDHQRYGEPVKRQHTDRDRYERQQPHRNPDGDYAHQRSRNRFGERPPKRNSGNSYRYGEQPGRDQRQQCSDPAKSS